MMTVMSLAMEAHWTCQVSIKVESNNCLVKLKSESMFYMREIQKIKVEKKNSKLTLKVGNEERNKHHKTLICE